MKKCGKVFLAAIAISLIATMANAANLIDYWNFDETDGAAITNGVTGRPDATLENYAGNNAATGWTTDVPAALSHSTGSFHFYGGVNQYLLLQPRDGYDAIDSGDAFSVSMWIKSHWLPTTSADMGLFGIRDFLWSDMASLSTLTYVHSQSGAININRKNSNSQATGAVATAEAWNHVTFVCENNSVSTYLNGNFAGTITNCNLNYSTTGQSMQIGGKIHAITGPNGEPYDAEFGTSYSGYMDDISAWDSALMPWDVKALANGANPTTYESSTPSFDFADYSEVVNVNFVNSAEAAAYTGSAAIAEAGNVWNAVVADATSGVAGGVSAEVVNAVNGAGVATGISVYLNGFDSTFDYGSSATGELFRNGLSVPSTTTMNEWQIDGLTAGKTYDLVIYHEGQGGVNFTSGVASELTGSVLAFEGLDGSSKFAASEIWAEGYNYSAITIVPTSSTVTGTFCVENATLGGSSNEWSLAGLQIALHETASPNIPGDANKDGKVDGSDVTILAGNWQTLTGANWGMGDFNGDGKVDGSDVTILAGNWQQGVSSAAASVPEPSTFVGLFTLCLLGVLKFSRKIKKVAVMMLVALTITSFAPMAMADLYHYWDIEGTVLDYQYDIPDLVGGNTASLIGMGDEWDTETPAALASSTTSLKLTPTNSSWISLGNLGISSKAGETSNPVEALTISMWIKPVSLSSDTRFFGMNTYGYDSTDINSQTLRLNGGTLEWIGVDKGLPFVEHAPFVQGVNQCGFAPFHACADSNIIQTNQWSNLIMVWEKDRMSTYINGELVGYYHGEGVFIDLNGSETTLGGKFINEHGNSFDGYVDDVAIWGHALSNEGIAAISAGVSPMNVEVTVTDNTPTYDQVVNVDFKFGSLPQYAGQGAVSQAGTVWNEPVVSGARNAVGATQEGLVDSEGNATTMGVSVSGFESGFAAPVDSGYWREPNALLDDRLIASVDTDNFWSIDGLEVGATYDILFYGQGESDITLTDGAATDSTFLLRDTGGRIVAITNDTPEDWDESMTYAVLTVTPTDSTISGSILPSAEGVDYMGLAGIQICKYAAIPTSAASVAVPEPATWCGLMALFLGGWFFQKRRNGR